MCFFIYSQSTVMYKRGCTNLNNINFKRQLFLQVVKEALRMRAVSAIRFSHSDGCEAFDTSDHTDLFVCLQHRLAASVLTLSFQQSFLCLYKKHILPLQQVTPPTSFSRVLLPGPQLSQFPLCVSQSPLTPNCLKRLF